MQYQIVPQQGSPETLTVDTVTESDSTLTLVVQCQGGQQVRTVAKSTLTSWGPV